MEDAGRKILILGGSGFIGHALYKELCNYYDTYGTYCSAHRTFEDNQHFYSYDMQDDDIVKLLQVFVDSGKKGGTWKTWRNNEWFKKRETASG